MQKRRNPDDGLNSFPFGVTFGFECGRVIFHAFHGILFRPFSYGFPQKSIPVHAGHSPLMVLSKGKLLL